MSPRKYKMSVYSFQTCYILFGLCFSSLKIAQCVKENKTALTHWNQQKDVSNVSNECLLKLVELQRFVNACQLITLKTTHLNREEWTTLSSYETVIEFNAYNDTFVLFLFRHLTAVSPDLAVNIGTNKMSWNDMQSDIGIYTGTVNNTKVFSSNVYGKLDRDSFDGYMNLNGDTFYIEPYRKYNKSEIFRGTSVIYRESDIIYDKKSIKTRKTKHEGRNYTADKTEYTRYITLNPTTMAKIGLKNDAKARQRRSVMSSTCILHIVADHTFFQNVGGGSYIATITELLYHVGEADRIFRSTDFDGDGTGDNIGFIVSDITIYPDKEIDNYLLADESINAYEYLDTFSLTDFSEFCLAVAFTYRDFADGVVGLAWMGNSNLYGAAGGICQYRVRLHTDNKLYSFNTGIVTFLNNEVRIPSYKSALTLVHELGHSFGSPHDVDDDPECSPSSSFGKYIMHPYSNDGSKPNHNRFSSCSIDSMYPVIVNKGFCFSVQTGPVCGNGIREESEECDCGNEQSCFVNDKSHCCTPMTSSYTPDAPCTFRRYYGKVCSPKFASCCSSNCMIMSSGQVCREETECRYESYCDGLNTDCPSGGIKADGTLCHNGRKMCKNGTCVQTLCEASEMEDCQCLESSQLCVMCCRNMSTGVCLPFISLPASMKYKSNGEPCNEYKGFCDGTGTCIARDPDSVIQRLNNVFSEEGAEDIKAWVQNYWYYVLLGVVGFMFISFIFIATRQKPDTTHTTAYRMGRLERVLASATLEREKQKVRMEETVKQYNAEIEKVRTRTFATEYTQALARLTMFFPTAPRHIIARVATQCSSEDAAVRLMLIKGYPCRRLAVLNKNSSATDVDKGISL